MVRGYHAYKDIWTAVVGGASLPTGESQPSGPVCCGSAEGRSDRSWSDGSGQGALGGWKRVPRL